VELDIGVEVQETLLVLEAALDIFILQKYQMALQLLETIKHRPTHRTHTGQVQEQLDMVVPVDLVVWYCSNEGK
jgi:hypothetical protein